MAKQQQAKAENVSVRSIVAAEQEKGASISQTQTRVLVEVLHMEPDQAEKIVRAITTTRGAIAVHRKAQKIAQAMREAEKGSKK
jgi:hypothetical protein